MRNLGLPRYNIEYYSVETGDEKQDLWLPLRSVLGYVRGMKNGDDLVIHRTDSDAEEGTIYP